MQDENNRESSELSKLAAFCKMINITYYRESSELSKIALLQDDKLISEKVMS